MAFEPSESKALVGEEEVEEEELERLGDQYLDGKVPTTVPGLEDYDSETAAAITISYSHKSQSKLGHLQSLSRGFKVIRYALTILAFVMLLGFLVAAVTLIYFSPSCKHKNDGLEWWKTAVIYQCYPRSFKDSNGDGSGDLAGIVSKLDYLHDLGVEAVWLNPIFRSPKKDNGYDITDYMDIDPLYGTMADFKLLVSELHSKEMYLILDFVPNHTSDEHEWFIESQSSLDSSKRDWYIWANASAGGGPPNNWLSLFGGSAWSFDNLTNQYYLHQFSEFQPDLNYRNPDVKEAMENVIKFWLDLGVDGFRIDAIIFLLEDSELRDEAVDPSYDMNRYDCLTTNYSNPDCYKSLIHNYTKDFTGIHSIIKSWRNISDSYTGSPKFLVGETFDPVDVVMTYYGTDNDELNFPFNFLLLTNTNWTGDSVSECVSAWMDALPEGAWPNWVLGNHDYARIANNAGNYLARALNVLLLTLPGTPTTYYGEEIFMTDVYVPPTKRHDLYQDRDKERTPMQWENSANAGFTNRSATPWLPIATNYSTYNVDVESSNASSMLALYKRVVQLITTEKAFRFANYQKVMSNHDLFAFHRFHNETKSEYVVLVNFSQSNTSANLTLIKDTFQDAVIELSSSQSSRAGKSVDLSKIPMAAGEAVIINGCSTGNCDVI